MLGLCSSSRSWIRVKMESTNRRLHSHFPSDPPQIQSPFPNLPIPSSQNSRILLPEIYTVDFLYALLYLDFLYFLSIIQPITGTSMTDPTLATSPLLNLPIPASRKARLLVPEIYTIAWNLNFHGKFQFQ
ncbi:unnamed protein product [Microthlaspi erraticum]|uniref:Uncharacterized protein n=1 Tax=Microthlaspi erraticum TaxID=1685480 RepID=A0A6D2HTA7_9BRAS|nr:unnamed protein product [Microthlaspi erraticum]